MANHKASEPRVLMKVPKSFKERVLNVAHAEGTSATVYLENKTVAIIINRPISESFEKVEGEE